MRRLCRRSETRWSNFPIAYQGQLNNVKYGSMATMAVEGCFDRNMYFCSWFARRCGYNNDLVLVKFFPVITDILGV